MQSRLVILLIRSRHIVGRVQLKEAHWLEHHAHLLIRHDREIYHSQSAKIP